MTANDIRALCQRQRADHAKYQLTGEMALTLSFPRPWHAPKGFPRGERLCDQIGYTVRCIPVAKLEKWLDKYFPEEPTDGT